jgi:hypothetical protein
MGFAPPLRSGFAFFAAHGCACRLPCIPTPDESPMNSEGPHIFFDLFFETSCELVYQRPRIRLKGLKANFGALRLAELPRIPKRRTSQNSYSTHSGE